MSIQLSPLLLLARDRNQNSKRFLGSARNDKVHGKRRGPPPKGFAGAAGATPQNINRALSSTLLCGTTSSFARPSRAARARSSYLNRRRIRRAIAQRSVLDLQHIIFVRD